ncbi:MAG TPA: hypothetical protein VNS58_08935 [Puia sp.]|nr:hypothetical protein [Puia sp.]
MATPKETITPNISKREAPVPETVIKTSEPIQIESSDNIEFKLTKATGSSRSQSVTLTLVLTTSVSNWYIMSAVHSIMDGEGNEYKLKSFTIGSNNYHPKVELTT